MTFNPFDMQEAIGGDPNRPLTATSWNNAKAALQEVGQSPDLSNEGSYQSLLDSQQSARPYTIPVASFTRIPKYSVFGIWAGETDDALVDFAGRAEIERVPVTLIDNGTAGLDAGSFSPLALLTNGPYDIASNAGSGGGGRSTGWAQIIDQHHPVRLTIAEDEDFANFRVGYPCGPKGHSSPGVSWEMPGFVILGRLPKETGSGAGEFDDRSHDQVLVVRSFDMPMFGRMMTNVSSRGGDTMSKGYARITWRKGGFGDISGSGSSGITIDLEDAFRPDPDSGSGGNSDTSTDYWELPVINASLSTNLAVSDLVAICPVLGLGFVATPLC